jgi:hypothetical protein
MMPLFETWWYSPHGSLGFSMFDLHGEPTGLVRLAFLAGMYAERGKDNE